MENESISKSYFISSNIHERIDKAYEVSNNKKDILGKGSHGVVMKAKNKFNGEYRAIKIIKKKKITEAKDRNKIFEEYEIMRKIVI